MFFQTKSTVAAITAPLGKIVQELRDFSVDRRIEAGGCREEAEKLRDKAADADKAATEADNAARNIERLLGA